MPLSQPVPGCTWLTAASPSLNAPLDMALLTEVSLKVFGQLPEQLHPDSYVALKAATQAYDPDTAVRMLLHKMRQQGMQAAHNPHASHGPHGAHAQGPQGMVHGVGLSREPNGFVAGPADYGQAQVVMVKGHPARTNSSKQQTLVWL